MIEDQIRVFIQEELSTEGSGASLTDDSLLLEQHVIDSLGLFHLVGYLESEFGIEVDDAELIPENFGTVRDITRLVEIKREEGR
jgi:acyl carrier protein